MGRRGPAVRPPKGASLLSLRNLAYYVVGFANEGASVAFFAIAVVLLAGRGLAPVAIRGPRPLDGLMWTWLLAGDLLLTVVRNKAADRYVILVIPPALVLMTTALLRQPQPWRRLAVAASAVLAGAANFAGHTWPASGVRLLKWRPPLGLKAYTRRTSPGCARRCRSIPAGGPSDRS